MKFEILAPAGSMESLIAGVRSGADAVYLGGKLFNARRNAGNFDDEQLEQAVLYCHNRGVKVYMTANILISDRELGEAYIAAEKALSYGVDAFIVQDIGVAKMIRECFPQARIHASTQMSIMSPAGVRFAESLGFDRIVLPREMTLDEIREIRSATDAELEIFVHGALCMSVSGQCYMSSMIGSRSGNRGLCAQPCRLPFKVKGGANDHALSLKDLSIIDHLSELDGVTSLKIEGRMKRPEYVSAAVTAVKNALSGKYDEKSRRLLQSVFSRSGFTDGYLTGRTGADMFGIRRKEDVTAAAAALKSAAKNYEHENPLVKADMIFVCEKGKPSCLTIKALGKTATVFGSIPEAAINKPLTEEAIRSRLSKLGGTQFYAENIEIALDEGLMMPAAAINDMRRRAVAKIDESKKTIVSAKPFNFKPNAVKNKKPYFTASFKSAKQIPQDHPFRRIFIPLESPTEDFLSSGAGAVMPRGLFSAEKKITEKLLELKKAGVNTALCGNYGSYMLARELGYEAYGDFGLNIYNSLSASMIKSPILSFEMTLAAANAVEAEDTGVIVYGRLPLMLTRNCPVKCAAGSCRGKNECCLTDRKGCVFPVICSSYPCVEILNSVPLCLSDKMDRVKTDFAHFYFSTESRQEVENIIGLFKKGEKPDFKFTRGLYRRGTL